MEKLPKSNSSTGPESSSEKLPDACYDTALDALNSIDDVVGSKHTEQKWFDFNAAAVKIKKNGESVHAQEHNSGGNQKEYHTSIHLLILEKCAKKLSEILHLDKKQIALSKMVIAWHDTTMEYDNPDPNNILGMIRRHRGAKIGDEPSGIDGNENISAQRLEKEMREANQKAGTEIFSEEDIQTGISAVHATYPDVKFNFEFTNYPYYQEAINQNPSLEKLFLDLERSGITKGNLFSQPHLEDLLENNILPKKEVLVMALSDLSEAGASSSYEFFASGDKEMRELYHNLRYKNILNSLAKDVAGVEDRKKMITAFLAWMDSQSGFVAWQALRFEKIIYLYNKNKGIKNSITEEEEVNLRKYFSQYSQNTSSCLRRAKDTRQHTEEIMSQQENETSETDENKKDFTIEAFSYIAKKMGYILD